MIPAVDIRHDMNGIAARIGLMAKDRMKAAANAINASLTTVRAEASRELAAGEYRGLRVGAIKGRIKQSRASQAQARAALAFSGKRIRLYNWQLSSIQTRWGTGVRSGSRMPAQLLRIDAISGRAREVSAAELKSAFIQRSRRWSTPNVWLRQGKDSVPIDVLVSPSLSETLVQKRLNAAYARRARERFQVVFTQQARRYSAR